jgi:hypothetical protein
MSQPNDFEKEQSDLLMRKGDTPPVKKEIKVGIKKPRAPAKIEVYDVEEISEKLGIEKSAVDLSVEKKTVKTYIDYIFILLVIILTVLVVMIVFVYGYEYFRLSDMAAKLDEATFKKVYEATKTVSDLTITRLVTGLMLASS